MKGFIWQAMKCHILTILGNLEMEDGREVQEENDMIAWANAKV